MKNNKELSRFELEIEGHITFADYKFDGKVFAVTHIFTPPEARGQGAAGKLMQEICDYLKTENLKIKPICPYAVTWLERHKEFDFLLA